MDELQEEPINEPQTEKYTCSGCQAEVSEAELDKFGGYCEDCAMDKLYE